MRINWQRDYPVERVALGLIGAAGFVSTEAARFLMMQPFLNGPRKMATSLGRELNESTISSRLRNHHEIASVRDQDPRSYRKGREIADQLIPMLKKAGV